MPFLIEDLITSGALDKNCLLTSRERIYRMAEETLRCWREEVLPHFESLTLPVTVNLFEEKEVAPQLKTETEKKYTFAEIAAAFTEIAVQKNKLAAVGMSESDAEDYAFKLYAHDNGADFSPLAKSLKDILS